MQCLRCLQLAEARNAHARYFAGREADIMALWDSPQQRAAYDWFTVELANLRAAFRWAADHDDLDVAATIATYASRLGMYVEQYEPIAWAEELIEPARAADHPALATLYLVASGCFMAGRPEAAVRYSEAGQTILNSGHGTVPGGFESFFGYAYAYIGQPERTVAWCRAQLARGRDTHFARRTLVIALVIANRGNEARAATDGLIEAAEATRNPRTLAFALYAYGVAFRNADPDRAREALHRSLVIAHDSGNRGDESNLAAMLAGLEALHGDPLAAFDYVTMAIRNHHDSGNHTHVCLDLAELAVILHRLRRHESAATIAGFALTPLTKAHAELNAAIARLRDVLGDQTYESLARKGATMTTAAMAAFAHDQIDQARTALKAVAK